MILEGLCFCKLMKTLWKFVLCVGEVQAGLVQDVIFMHGLGAGENRIAIFFGDRLTAPFLFRRTCVYLLQHLRCVAHGS